MKFVSCQNECDVHKTRTEVEHGVKERNRDEQRERERERKDFFSSLLGDFFLFIARNCRCCTTHTMCNTVCITVSTRLHLMIPKFAFAENASNGFRFVIYVISSSSFGSAFRTEGSVAEARTAIKVIEKTVEIAHTHKPVKKMAHATLQRIMLTMLKKY